MPTLEPLPWGGETTPMGFGATIPPDLARALLDTAERAGALEACGLLLGVADAGGFVVASFIATDNVALDPRRSYTISAKALADASRQGEIIGVFHSHPNGKALPSTRDASEAQAGWLYVIAAQGSLAAFVAR